MDINKFINNINTDYLVPLYVGILALFIAVIIFIAQSIAKYDTDLEKDFIEHKCNLKFKFFGVIIGVCFQFILLATTGFPLGIFNVIIEFFVVAIFGFTVFQLVNLFISSYRLFMDKRYFNENFYLYVNKGFSENSINKFCPERWINDLFLIAQRQSAFDYDDALYNLIIYLYENNITDYMDIFVLQCESLTHEIVIDGRYKNKFYSFLCHFAKLTLNHNDFENFKKLSYYINFIQIKQIEETNQTKSRIADFCFYYSTLFDYPIKDVCFCEFILMMILGLIHFCTKKLIMNEVFDIFLELLDKIFCSLDKFKFAMKDELVFLFSLNFAEMFCVLDEDEQVRTQDLDWIKEIKEAISVKSKQDVFIDIALVANIIEKHNEIKNKFPSLSSFQDEIVFAKKKNEYKHSMSAIFFSDFDLFCIFIVFYDVSYFNKGNLNSDNKYNWLPSQLDNFSIGNGQRFKVLKFKYDKDSFFEFLKYMGRL